MWVVFLNITHIFEDDLALQTSHDLSHLGIYFHVQSCVETKLSKKDSNLENFWETVVSKYRLLEMGGAWEQWRLKSGHFPRGGTHIFGRTGMCRSNGSLFYKKSLNTGPVFYQKNP